MKNIYAKNGRRSGYITPEEKERCAAEIEKQYPGYQAENEKLRTMVWIMTGLRVLYGLFYLYISMLFGFSFAESVMILAQAVFFLLWFSLMLRSTKLISIMMLVLRGYVIVQSGVSVILTAHYMPLSIIFTLILSIVLEFVAAVFCIYLLFNKKAAETVNLNILLDRGNFRRQSGGSLEKEASYQNPYTGESEEEQPNEAAEKKDKEEENKTDFT